MIHKSTQNKSIKNPEKLKFFFKYMYSFRGYQIVNGQDLIQRHLSSFMYLVHKMEMESVAFEKEGPSQNQSDQC